MKTKPHILGAMAILCALVSVATSVQADYLIGLGLSDKAGIGRRPLYKIDLADGSIVQAGRSPFSSLGPDVYSDLAYGDDFLWGLGLSGNVGAGRRSLYKLNPDDGTIVRMLKTPFATLGPDVYRGLVYGDGYLWGLGLSANVGAGQRPLYQIDPADGRIVRTLTTPFRGLGPDLIPGLAYGGGYLWALGTAGYAGTGRRPLYKIDPTDGRIVQTLTTPFTGIGTDLYRGLVYGGGYLWGLGLSANAGAGRRPLYKIDPTDGRIVQTLTTPFTGIGPDVYRLAYVSEPQIALP